MRAESQKQIHLEAVERDANFDSPDYNGATVPDLANLYRRYSAYVAITLANRLETDPWFTIPHMATDAFAKSLATLIRDSLEDGLKVYVEHSNAPWNSATAQYRRAVEAGAARWGDADGAAIQWHAMRTALLCDIFKTEMFVDALEYITQETSPKWEALTAFREIPCWWDGC